MAKPGNININLQNQTISPSSLPLWATEDTLAQLSISLGSKLNNVNRNLNTNNQTSISNSNKIANTLKNIKDNGIFGAAFDIAAKKFTKSINVASLIIEGIKLVARIPAELDDFFKEYREQIETLSDIGIGLVVPFRNVSLAAMNAGMKTEELTQNLAAAGIGLQVFQKSIDDVVAGQDAAVTGYARIINNMKSLTGQVGFLGLSFESMTNYTNDYLESARLMRVQEQFDEETQRSTIADSIVSLVTAATEYSRQTNADRERLIKGVTSLLQQDTVAFYLQDLPKEIRDQVGVAFTAMQAAFPNQESFVSGIAKMISTEMPAGIIEEFDFLKNTGLFGQVEPILASLAESTRRGEDITPDIQRLNAIVSDYVNVNRDQITRLAAVNPAFTQLQGFYNNLQDIFARNPDFYQAEQERFSKLNYSIDTTAISVHNFRKELDSIVDTGKIAGLDLVIDGTEELFKKFGIGIADTTQEISTSRQYLNQAKEMLVGFLKNEIDDKKENTTESITGKIDGITKSFQIYLDSKTPEESDSEIKEFLQKLNEKRVQVLEGKDVDINTLQQDAKKLLEDQYKNMGQKEAALSVLQDKNLDLRLQSDSIASALAQRTLNVNIVSAQDGFISQFSNGIGEFFSYNDNYKNNNIIASSFEKQIEQDTNFKIEDNRLEQEAYTAMKNFPQKIDQLITAIKVTDPNNRLKALQDVMSENNRNYKNGSISVAKTV